jgi:cardiolipin synthase
MNDSLVDEVDDRRTIRARVEARLRPLTFPNFLTLLRMAITPFIVLAIFDHDFKLALTILIIAGITDILDGWIARRFDVRSMVGAYLDPIADKLLITVTYVTLTFDTGQAVVVPLWLTILALFRDFLISFMAVFLYVVQHIRQFPPSRLGKATMTAHVVTVGVVLVANAFWLPSWVPTVCFYASFVLVILSGFGYIYRTSRMIEAIHHGGPGSELPSAAPGPVEGPAARRGD